MYLRLWETHRTGTHPEITFPVSGCKGKSFYSWVGGYCLGCAPGVCCNFLGDKAIHNSSLSGAT